MFSRVRASEKVVWQDALLVMCSTAIMAAFCVEFNFSEALRRWTAPFERFQLDELPAVLVVLAAGLAWFAARRYGEAGRELRRRRLAEAQLEAALLDNRRLAQQYVRLQEAEQKRLARELHDELGQYLNVIKLDAVALRDGRWSDAAGLQECAEAIVANCNHIHGLG
jgi:two-component system, NarL family, sensor histidine kinase UhpB